MRMSKKIKKLKTKIDAEDPVQEKILVQESKLSVTTESTIEAPYQKNAVTEAVVPMKQKNSVDSTKTYLRTWKRLKSRLKKPNEMTALYLSAEST